MISNLYTHLATPKFMKNPEISNHVNPARDDFFFVCCNMPKIEHTEIHK